MHAVRLVFLTVLLMGLNVLMACSVARSLRTGTVALRGNRKCHRSTRPICFWASIIVTIAAAGVLTAAWVWAMYLQLSST